MEIISSIIALLCVVSIIVIVARLRHLNYPGFGDNIMANVLIIGVLISGALIADILVNIVKLTGG